MVVLPEPCRPTIRIGTGGGGVEVERHRALAAERLDHHVVDDLDDLLAGGDGAQHLGADGAFADLGDEVAHHRQGHVGVEQGEADFAQRFGDVGLAQRAAAAQAVEDAGELVGQGFEHGRSLQSQKRRCANPRGAAEPPRWAGTGWVGTRMAGV